MSSRVLCASLLTCSRAWRVLVSHVPRALGSFVPNVLYVLCAHMPYVLRSLGTLVSHVLSYLTCPFYFVPCVLHASITFAALVFSCFTWLFLIYFQLVSFFGKFNTIKIKAICRQHFEVTVKISLQNAFELYLEKLLW